MPFKGGGSIGGPRTKKGKPKHPVVRVKPQPPKTQGVGPVKSGKEYARMREDRDRQQQARVDRGIKGMNKAGLGGAAIARQPAREMVRKADRKVEKAIKKLPPAQQRIERRKVRRMRRAAERAADRALAEKEFADEDKPGALERFIDDLVPGGAFGSAREDNERADEAEALASRRARMPAGTAAVASIDQATKLARKAALSAGKAPGEIGINAAKDAVNFPSQAVVSTYYTGKLLKEGKFKEAGEGLIEPYKQLAKDPLGTAYEHPFNTYLLVGGPKGAVGRGAGKAARTGALGKTAKKAASTQRKPKALPGTSLEEPRSYSPDVTVKARQVAVEKTRRASSRRLVRKADKARKAGDDERADRLAEKAVRRDPDRMTDREIARRVDERVDATEVQRRVDRADITRKVDRALPRKSSAHVSLTAQGITRASKDDLRAYRRELVAEQESLRGSRLGANKRLVKQIDAALKVPDEKVASATSAYKTTVRPLKAKMVDAGMVARGQADRRELMPYAVRNMGAKHVPTHYETRSGRTLTNAEVRRLRSDLSGDGFRERVVRVEGHLADKDGRPLTNEQILAHMREHGADTDPVYVTQAPKSRNAYFVSSDQAPSSRTGKFTGEATRKGLFNADRESLRENAARQQGLVSAQEGFSKFVGEFGGRDKTAKVKTYPSRKRAVQVADEMRHHPDGTPNPQAPKMVPIRLKPFAGREEQLQALLDRVDPENQQAMRPVHEAMRDALDGKDGPGPWALVPEAAVKRLQDHVRLLGPSTGAKTMQALNSAFRQTVLATSTRWMTGNVIEGTFRAAVGRAGPRSLATAVRVRKRVRDVDPEAAKEFEARVTGGGLYTMQTRMPRRGAEQFAGTRMEPLANALHRFWETPGPKQIAGAWRAYTNVVFEQLNKRFENTVQLAMAGKEIRTSGLMDGRVVKLSNKAVDQAARGLRNTPEQVALGRAVDRMYGRYSKFSPTKRQAIVLYTPFVAWSLNALEFIYRVLPRDHPVLSALIVSMEEASEEWRKEHGLDKFMAGRVPNFLQGSIPVSGGGKQRAPNRYLPFAAVSQGIPETLADSILPQFSSTLLAARGREWTGNAKSGDPDDLENAKSAVWAFMESTIPALAMTERVVKEGPNKAFNPFLPSRSKSAAKDPWDQGWGKNSGWDDGWSGKSDKGGWD